MDFFYFVIAILVALTIHECAHAWVADRLGDPTAKYEGRISLNPLKHLDPWGTIMFILIRIGWGKPVPVNPRNFRQPVRDSAVVALAGPASNILLALLLSLPLKYAPLGPELLQFLQITMFYNLLLAIFNFLPFPPLDGSKILGLIIPKRWHYGYIRYLENGMVYFLLFLLFDSFVLTRVVGFSILGTAVFSLVEIALSLIFIGT